MLDHQAPPIKSSTQSGVQTGIPRLLARSPIKVPVSDSEQKPDDQENLQEVPQNLQQPYQRNQRRSVIGSTLVCQTFTTGHLRRKILRTVPHQDHLTLVVREVF